MKTDQEIIQTLNKHLNLAGLVQDLSADEWNRIIAMLEDNEICFSGDPSGFHIDLGNEILDCSHPDTSLV